MRTLLAALLVGTLANAAVHPGDQDRTLDHDGRVRTYHVHAPPAVDGTTPLPLVIDIGSDGARGRWVLDLAAE